MAAKVRIKQTGNLRKVMHSDKLAEQLEVPAGKVLEHARNDPNPAYVATLRIRRHHSGGRGGRVSIRVGAAPGIGDRVEAKRGTLQRALGAAGL